MYYTIVKDNRLDIYLDMIAETKTTQETMGNIGYAAVYGKNIRI